MHKDSWLQGAFTFGGRRPLITFVVLLVATVFSVAGALRLKIDTSYDRLISDHDPGWADYSRSVDEFGSDNTVIIYVRDPALFSIERLTALDALVRDLKKNPEIQKVDSLFSALSIRDVDGELTTDPVVDGVPTTAEEAEQAKVKALYSPLVRRNLLSDDAKVTAVTLSLAKSAANRDTNYLIYEAIEASIAKVKGRFERIYQIGPPRLNVEIERGMNHDLAVFMPLSTLVLVATVFFFLRTWTATVVPLITAGTSILWTLGFMGWTGIPLTLLTTLVPALNIVIGSAEDTHMMSGYLRAVAGQKARGQAVDRMAAIRFMTGHISLAIILTSSTTVIGFLSDALYDVPIMIDFAFSAAFALTANFFVTVLAMPMMLRLMGPTDSHLPPMEEAPSGLMGKFILFLEMVGRDHRRTVLVIFALITVVAGWFTKDIRVSNDPLSYFKQSSPLVQDARRLHDDVSGMQVFYVTLRATGDKTFKDPELLRQVAGVEDLLRKSGSFDKVLGLPDFLALVHREMNRGEERFHVIPGTTALIEQYLLLFQRRDLERYATSDYRNANIVVRHNISDSSAFNEILAGIDRQVQAAGLSGVTVGYIGKNLMINRTAEGLILNQADSLLWVTLTILGLMALLYQSLFAGVISMIPNMVPIVICFGTMGLIGLPLNPGTASVAAVALGIAVDDTIHFFSAYLGVSRHEADPDQAIKQTFYSEVVPVITTTLALSLGFVILAGSNFTIVAQYGLLSAYTIFTAMFVDLFMTPALLRGVRLVGVWDVIAFNLGDSALVHSAVFKGMSKLSIKKAILAARLSHHEAGETVIRQGDRGAELYLILEGSVEVVVTGDDGSEQVMRRLGPGQNFGEIGFVGESARTADVRTTRKCILVVMDAEIIRRGLRFYPWIRARLHQNICAIIAERMAMPKEKPLGVPGGGHGLQVIAGGASHVVSAANPELRLGRGPSNDIVVEDSATSECHASIRFVNGVFFLSDHSTQGSFLADEGGERKIRLATHKLAGCGRIGLGRPSQPGTPTTIEFAPLDTIAAPGGSL